VSVHADLAVAFGLSALAVLGSAAYFRRYEVPRPPIGRVNLRDVGFLLAAIIVVPYLYLAVPLAVVAGMLSVAVISLLLMAGQPVLGGPRRAGAVACAVVVADVSIAIASGTMSPAFLAFNNLVVVVFVIGAANLWAQSGMTARDATVLGAGLIVYDVVATSQLTLMDELITRLSHVPLMPFVLWHADGGALGIGFGDLVLASVFPLVMRKAFGRRAGTVAIALGLGAIAVLMALVDFGVIVRTVPAMVALGPLMIVQYAFWRRGSRERTTRQYLLADPLPARARA
jgi:hypothetical protein